MRNFTVYSMDGCSYCAKIISVLQLSELRYVEYKLDRDFNRESFYQQFGEGATLPKVVMNGDNLGGCPESIKYMQENDMCCRV